MRRVAGLWPHVIAFESLHRAAHAVLRGKRSRPSAGDLFFELESELLSLQGQLASHRYRPGPYRTFWIHEPKPRLISAAPIRDRVVHHALVAAIEPVFERRFVHHSYACRRGRGTHRALRQFVAWARSSRFVLKLDVHRFFPSIDHAILKQRLRRSLKDPDVLWLCDTILDASNEQEPCTAWFSGDDLFTPFVRRRGIPIGNLTSQFFANVLLDALDHFVVEELRIGRYLRYVDDVCLFGDDKARLRAARSEIVRFLEAMRLRLNEGKSRLRRVSEGVEFLGFVVWPDQLRLGRTAVRRQRRRMKRLRRGFAAGTVRAEDVSASVVAWVAHASQGSTSGLRRHVLRGAFGRGATPAGVCPIRSGAR
jgi:retron-type reverse transcriptase